MEKSVILPPAINTRGALPGNIFPDTVQFFFRLIIHISYRFAQSKEAPKWHTLYNALKDAVQAIAAIEAVEGELSGEEFAAFTLRYSKMVAKTTSVL
jgi:hypothetical protein